MVHVASEEHVGLEARARGLEVGRAVRMLWSLWLMRWVRIAAGLSLGAERAGSQAQAVDLTRCCGACGVWPGQTLCHLRGKKGLVS